MQGLGVSNLFHFFLLQSDGVSHEPMERKASDSEEKPENATEQEDVSSERSGALRRSVWQSRGSGKSARRSRTYRSRYVWLQIPERCRVSGATVMIVKNVSQSKPYVQELILFTTPGR